MFLSSRLIVNSRWLWNSHQRHKFLRAEASRDILKIRVSEMAFPEVFKRYFPPWTPSFLDLVQLECFTDLNLLEYVFNVIQNWEMDDLQFYSMVLIFS